MKRLFTLMTVLLCAALVAVANAATPMGTAFTYQGSLDRNGIAPTDSCTFTFALWDSPLNGTLIGATITTKLPLLQNGQFSIPLDFGVGMFDGNQRWLDVGVKCPGDGLFTSLTPRQAITATPYALYALNAPAGSGSLALPYFGTLTSAAADGFKVQNNATTGATYAVHGVSASSSASSGAVLGEATGASGTTLGVYGKATVSPSGTGVVGQGSQTGGWFEAFNTTGDGTGLNGVAHTTTNSAAGVKGTNLSTTGQTVGIWGLASASANGTGVGGIGGALGGYFTSTAGTGAVGTGGTNGGYFTSNNTDAILDYAGVYGISAVHPGVRGASTSAEGVYGGGATGVRGAAISGSNGTGVYGTGDGSGVGVRGFVYGSGTGVTGTSLDGYGVYGEASTNYGVYGTTSSAARAGVIGTTAAGDGVWGVSSASARSGVVGISNNAAGYGAYFANNVAGGVAMFTNGLAQVRTLQILGADLAESFPVGHQTIEPGTVLVIASSGDGSLSVCDEPYCKRVAGVVSGANGLDAAVVLKGKTFDAADHAAVAMSGRVWVRCDATHAPIHVGDLLTTSDQRGHAMRADDSARAYGAVIGKAMTALETGTGLVLVLVNLQ